MTTDQKPAQQMPTERDAERYIVSVLCAIPDCAAEVFERSGLFHWHFFDEAHAAIFRVLGEQYRQGAIDLSLAGVELNKYHAFQPDKKAAGFLLELQLGDQAAATGVHVQREANKIIEASKKRQLAKLGEAVRNEAMNGQSSDAIFNALTQGVEEFKRVANVGAHRYKIVSAAELEATKYAQEYYIADVLAAGDLAMFGGPEKSLKTSFLVDMFLALSKGGHFLGTFPVTRSCRTLLFSGESGMANLQSIAKRVCCEGGYPLASLDNFAISPDLPLFDSDADLSALESVFKKHKPDVVGFDPMMLCVGDTDENAGNLFVMGKLLRQVYELCQKFNATPIIAHHTTTMQLGTIPKLSNLAWSGFKQAAGQWILLNRRNEYQPGTGRHEMLMVTGGRSGHNLMRAVDVEEGTTEGVEGRYWRVSVNRVDDAREAEQQHRADAKATASRQQREDDKRAIVLGAASLDDRQGTKTNIRTASGIRTERFDPAFAELLRNKDFEPVTITKTNNRKYDGFRLYQGAEL